MVLGVVGFAMVMTSLFGLYHKAVAASMVQPVRRSDTPKGDEAPRVVVIVK